MKAFLEVFPDLHMTGQMQELLNLVEVEKVSMTRDRSSIRVSIVSPRLIHKKNILDLYGTSSFQRSRWRSGFSRNTGCRSSIPRRSF